MKKLVFLVSPYTSFEIEKFKRKKFNRAAPLSFPLGVLNLSSTLKNSLDGYNEDNVKMPPEFRGGFPGDIRDGYYGYKKSRAFDYSYGYLQYSSNLGDVVLSMEPLVWGNTKNSIILSNNVNPFK